VSLALKSGKDTTLCIAFHVSTCKPLRSNVQGVYVSTCRPSRCNVCLFDSVRYLIKLLQKKLSQLSQRLNHLTINIYMVKDKFHLLTRFFHQAHRVLSPRSIDYQEVRMNRDTTFTARYWNSGSERWKIHLSIVKPDAVKVHSGYPGRVLSTF